MTNTPEPRNEVSESQPTTDGSPTGVPGPGLPGSQLGVWVRQPAGRLAATLAAALILVGAGGLIGHLLTSQGPPTLTAAIIQAAAGELPCGNTGTLPGALKAVCGIPTSQPAATPVPKHPGTAGLGALRAVFGPGALVGRITSVGPSRLTFGAPKKPISLGIAATTKALAVTRSAGTLATSPEPLSVLRPGLLVVVVPGPAAPGGGGRTALDIYTLAASTAGPVA